MVIFVVLNVWPVRHVECLVDCIAPLLCLHADAAFVLLCSEVLSVECVAVRELVDELLCSDGFPVERGSDDAAAVSDVASLLVLFRELLWCELGETCFVDFIFRGQFQLAGHGALAIDTEHSFDAV